MSIALGIDNGGHNGDGDEVQPLDEAVVREAILTRCEHVDVFAISGYFGVRNPSHEIRVRTFVEELTKRPNGLSMPVTCGHELTTHLDSIRRATTTVLNACLIPLLRELIATVRHILDTKLPWFAKITSELSVQTAHCVPNAAEHVSHENFAPILESQLLAPNRDAYSGSPLIP